MSFQINVLNGEFVNIVGDRFADSVMCGGHWTRLRRQSCVKDVDSPAFAVNSNLCAAADMAGELTFSFCPIFPLMTMTKTGGQRSFYAPPQPVQFRQ